VVDLLLEEDDLRAEDAAVFLRLVAILFNSPLFLPT
jgi:hypothetical protein